MQRWHMRQVRNLVLAGFAGTVVCGGSFVPAGALNLPTIPVPQVRPGLGAEVGQLLQVNGLDLTPLTRAQTAAPVSKVSGPVQAQPSGTLELAKQGLDISLAGGDDAGVQEAFPGTGVPRTPPHFAPDVIVNQDRSALPHNETSVAINPNNPDNLVVGANDYSLGFGTSGFYSTFDGGQSWYGGLLPMPTVYFEPPGQPTVPRTLLALDGGGDPAIAYGSDGTVYYSEINFHRVGCASGVFVYRSSNGGQTWARPLAGAPSPGDTRLSGDGVPAVNTNDSDCHTFYDKEYITTGPRPASAPVLAGSDPNHTTGYRLYVTYTNFFVVVPVAAPPVVDNTPVADLQGLIMNQYSDDQGRTWSTPQFIGGSSATLCSGALPVTLPPAPPGMNECVDSQGSDPVVDPRTGALYVTFWNGDGIDCTNQVLAVSSTDGGQTWSSPSRVSCLTVSYPTASSSVCPAAPSGEWLVSGFCFRVPPQTQQSAAVNPLDGSLHVTFADNRNGGTNWDETAPDRSDLDVFTAASTDGGKTWGGVVRVNQDKLKDGRDQFFPWSAFAPDGTFYVSFLDRSLDPRGHLIGESLAVSRDSGKTFRETAISTGSFDGNRGFRDGLFLGDYTGVAAGRLGAFAAWPDTRRAGVAITGDNPTQFWSDVTGGGTYSTLSAAHNQAPVATGAAAESPVQGADAVITMTAGTQKAVPLAPTGSGPSLERVAGRPRPLPGWLVGAILAGLLLMTGGLTAYIKFVPQARA